VTSVAEDGGKVPETQAEQMAASKTTVPAFQKKPLA